MSMDLSINYSYSSVPANYYLPHCAFLTTVCTHTCSHGASNSVGGILSGPLHQLKHLVRLSIVHVTGLHFCKGGDHGIPYCIQIRAALQ